MTKQPNIDAPITSSTPGEQPPSPERRGFLTAGLGCLTVLVGIPMLICPGPGLAAIVAGFGMIAVGLGLRAPKGS